MADQTAQIQILMTGGKEFAAGIELVIAKLRGLQLMVLPWWRAWPLRGWWWVRGARVG